MRVGRAVSFGLLGAIAISVITAGVRAAGIPLSIEMVLGTLTGMPPGPAAFGVGLVLHLVIGVVFGLFYAYLFESVWNHGGAAVGMLTAVVHVCLIGSLIGFTAQLHPIIPETIADPGPFFSNLGPVAALTFILSHVVYGAIVGAGYGNVAGEHQWAPSRQT